jgi:NDP-hexose 3,5-(Or5-) epimerase
MNVEETAIAGVFVVTPKRIEDERGAFYESLRIDRLGALIGRPFVPHQVAYSVSRRNTLRGIHTMTAPPGQAKYVTCVRGALRDFAVDLRVGSPTFGRHVATLLEPASACAVYIPEGVGHGFLALTDDTCICYVQSSVYIPGTQVDINPLDPYLELPWELPETPLMSEKDTNAPGVLEVLAAGLLAGWHEADK